MADERLEENSDRLSDAVVGPGGPDGSKNLSANAAASDFAFAIAFTVTGEGDKATEQAGHISHRLKMDMA